VIFKKGSAGGCQGSWRNLVAHRLREQGAGGSNPLAPTSHIEAVPPGAAFSLSVSGPRPVLPLVLQ